jgi:hypothetical protein
LIPQGLPPLSQVEQYLRDFKDKLQFFGFIIADRDKNSFKTLLKLGINGDSVRDCLLGLQATDYFQGPMPNQLAGRPDVWVFGHTCRGKEMYIKVYLGRFSRPVICVSFHLAQYPIQYPLKSRSPQLLQP